MLHGSIGLVAVVLALAVAQLAGCAQPNRYDGLIALPLEEVRPRVARTPGDTLPTVGIAFGGGGVRGFVHLGVLRALDEAGIPIHVVTGTSVGALAATLRASGLDYGQIAALAHSTGRFELLDPVFSREGAINGRAFAAWIRVATGGKSLGEFPIPVGVTVTDLEAGIPLLIVNGDPGEAVQASATVPGTVIPVRSNGRTLVDGGVLSIVPVRFTRAMGADVVVAVDIFCGRIPPLKGNAVDTVLNTLRLQSCLLSKVEIASADILIRPDFEPDDPVSFTQRNLAIEAGYRATMQALPAIRARLAGSGMPPSAQPTSNSDG
jgi:NTE family protein